MLLAYLPRISRRPLARSWSRFCSMLALAFLGVAASVSSHAAGPTGLLNDTGLTRCYNGTALVACNEASTGDDADFPRQDGRFGRDAASPAKVGGGAAGFDFTRVCQDGTLNCAGAANLVSPKAGDWACTKDNVTNLIWSLQTSISNWFIAVDLETTNADLSRLCGYNDGWRLPSRRELLSITMLDGPSPAIDANFFPGTSAQSYWTYNRKVGTERFWLVNLVDGTTGHGDSIADLNAIRLVHAGQ